MKRGTAIMLAISLLVGTGLWMRTSPKDVPYSEIKGMIAGGTIASATLTETEIQVTDKGGTEYESRLAKNDPALVASLDAAGVPYETERESFLSSFADAIPSLLFMLGATYLLFGKHVGFPGRFNFRTEKTEKVTFEDVAGYDNVKEELRDVIGYMRNPEYYGRLGAKPAKGILLEGPPGTGKTFFARAVAGEADVAFMSVTGTSFGSKYISVAGSKIDRLFDEAAAKAPCIVFIDEIDSVAAMRDDTGDTGAAQREWNNTLNALLTRMDGFHPTSGVVVIAATNRPNVLDPAIVRPGRFDRRIQVGLPGQVERHSILAKHASAVRAAENIPFDQLAVLTVGLAGAHLASLVNEAAVIATRRGAESVGTEDFLAAHGRIHGGIGTRPFVQEADLRRIAVHEAGHAIAAAAAGIGKQVRTVSVLGHGQALGHNLMIPEEGDDLIFTRPEILQKIVAYLGGTAAEETVLGERSSGSAADIQQVERLVHALVAELGLGASLPHRALNPNHECSPALLAAIEQEKSGIVTGCYDAATRAMQSNRAALDALAARLLSEETVGGDELQKLLSSVTPVDTSQILS